MSHQQSAQPSHHAVVSDAAAVAANSACADLDDGSSNIITSANIMIGCAMKNREGDLRTTVNNLIMGDEMNEGTVSAAAAPFASS